jgi:acetyltransferase-like isoleucine patch superfamily enzyme
MNPPATSNEGMRQLREFLVANDGARVFEWATGHPSEPTGFCPCDQSFLVRARFYLQATILLTLLKWPFNDLKVAALRCRGARVGRRVHISSDVWIDPIFPQLLTIEDNVLVGVGTKIALHEFGRDRFRAGRVTIRRGALIGGFALIGHGVEIGENAVVAGGAVVGRDVPAGMLAVGNPARNLPQKAADRTTADE